MIQAAVEYEMTNIRNREEILDYIIDVADEAIAVAKTKFDTSNINYDINKDREFLESFRKLAIELP